MKCSMDGYARCVYVWFELCAVQLPKCRCDLSKKENSTDWCPFGDDLQEEDNSIKVCSMCRVVRCGVYVYIMCVALSDEFHLFQLYLKPDDNILHFDLTAPLCFLCLLSVRACAVIMWFVVLIKCNHKQESGRLNIKIKYPEDVFTPEAIDLLKRVCVCVSVLFTLCV